MFIYKSFSDHNFTIVQPRDKAVEKQIWKYPGISQHLQHCSEPFNEENFEPLHVMQDKKKRRLGYNMRMREAFEIRCHDTGPGKGLNEDNGAYLKTDIWDPVLKALQWCSWYVVGWGGGAHPSWVLFCPILGFSLLYPLCVSVLSLFLILLPLMMTYRVMSKILVKKKLCVFIYSTWHSILHIENKLVLIQFHND